MATHFYRAYIAADALVKHLERIGAKFDSVSIPTVKGRGMYLYLDEWSTDHKYTWLGEKHLAKLREERERIIVAFLDSMPGSYSDRDGNSITLHGELHGVEYVVRVGEALCERVEVGEKEVVQIDPAYLADAPKVTVTEKVYEWRCSDDILGSMAHKASA
ncbi:hypothetical protein [Leucobacter sp. G161]|uniref:hypothetical protein n=1 Tax=Leucobacter sp. G161 TaxID=663704 RepID=UPI00073B8348|nr:hypothetical protein [Leucobacter sp. G161]KUF07250.1 hypothetical protein AUL38_10275 [Leucobacter sp. G161]